MKSRELAQKIGKLRAYEDAMERTQEAAMTYITSLWQIHEEKLWAFVSDDKHRPLYRSWAEYLRIRWSMPRQRAARLIASADCTAVPISEPKPTKRIEIADETRPPETRTEAQERAEPPAPLRLAEAANVRAQDCPATPRGCSQEELLPVVHRAMVDGQRRINCVATEVIRLKAMLAELAPAPKDELPRDVGADEVVQWAHYLQPEIQRLVGLCEEIKAQINHSAPYAPCPYCRQGDLKDKCSVCDGLRWVSRSIWNRTDKGLR